MLWGSRKVPPGCPGQIGFMLRQATFSNHFPARQALTHSMNENEGYQNHSKLFYLSGF